MTTRWAPEMNDEMFELYKSKGMNICLLNLNVVSKCLTDGTPMNTILSLAISYPNLVASETPAATTQASEQPVL